MIRGKTSLSNIFFSSLYVAEDLMVTRDGHCISSRDDIKNYFSNGTDLEAPAALGFSLLES